MTIIHVISFLVIAVAAGYLYEETLGDMLPFVWCGLILVLYVLSFGRLLNLIDFFMPAVAIGLMVPCIFRIKKNGLDEIIRYKTDNLLSVPFFVYLILCIVLPIALSAKVVTWWDDINFWASDLKSIYYIGGFASKYANVSPEYGDYPPGIQLAKWYLMHIAGRGYSESMAFVGYYLFNLSFAIPIFKNIKAKLPAMLIEAPVIALALWFLPGVCDKFGYAGYCADLSMAFVFGGVLILAFEDVHNELFDICRVILYLCMLPLIKSTGIIWAVIGMFIWIIVRYLRKKENVTFGTRRNILCNTLVVILPLVVWGSWEGFCLIRRRVAQSTATMVTYITTDKYGFSAYTGQFVKTFLKGFTIEPLHVDHTWIDLSALAILILVIAALILLYKKEYIYGRAGKFIMIVLPVIGILYYGLIFIAHITIFGSETQYLEAFAMAASIERYGLPFMMGSVLFISWLFIRGREGNISSILIWTVLILLLSDIPAAYNGVLGYRKNVNQDLETRAVFIDDASKLFVNSVHDSFPEGNVRICRVRDGGFYHAADAYVAYEASPASVMTVSYDLSQIDLNTLIYAVNQTHASYLYIDDQSEISGEKPEWLDDMVLNEDFSYGSLYYISFEVGSMVLYPAN